jgi:hypothetical protein
MTSHYYGSDDTCPEHQHRRFLASVMVTVPVLILASTLASLFGMA